MVYIMAYRVGEGPNPDIAMGPMNCSYFIEWRSDHSLESNVSLQKIVYGLKSSLSALG